MMKRKRICLFLLLSSLIFSACSKTPELLEPLGFDENSMEVVRGTMYNIQKTDNVVIYETMEVTVKSNAIVKSVNVALGDEVKAGDVLISLDGGSVSKKAEEIDNQIADKEADNNYLNGIKESEIRIAELEYQQMEQNGASVEELAEKRSEITNMENSYYQLKLKQEKELSELVLSKMDGGNVDSDITAPCDGVVMYLSNWNAEESIEKGSCVAIIGKNGSKLIKGEYLATDVVDACDEYYALINGKEYSVTNVPVDTNQEAIAAVFGATLENTYYINDGADEIDYGDVASVVFISERKEDVLYVPDEGIFQDIDGYYVYVKNKDGEKIRRDVEIGTVWETAVEIVSGLEEGEIIYGM